jgi:hypothetical protein
MASGASAVAEKINEPGEISAPKHAAQVQFQHKHCSHATWQRAARDACDVCARVLAIQFEFYLLIGPHPSTAMLHNIRARMQPDPATV